MSLRVEYRQFPFVGTELSYLGSFWGNHLDLVELLSLVVDVFGLDFGAVVFDEAGFGGSSPPRKAPGGAPGPSARCNGSGYA
jgi:hypothetical protein